MLSLKVDLIGQSEGTSEWKEDVATETEMLQKEVSLENLLLWRNTGKGMVLGLGEGTGYTFLVEISCCVTGQNSIQGYLDCQVCRVGEGKEPCVYY